MKVTVIAKVGDEEYELGWAELDSPDDPNLPAVLRGIADEIERTQGQGRMSYVTDVTMILTDWRDKERFEDLIEEHCLIRPATARNAGKCMGSYVYCMGVNYGKPELLDALLEGPWSSGSVLYLEREEWMRPLVKIFGDVPVLGWAEKPDLPHA